VDECLECGRLRISYNPCNDRHCPKCGAFEKAQWLEDRKTEMLPVTYHHVIFTTDHAINDVARVNKRETYHLLFQAATDTLKAYGQKYLGGEIGVTAVLHTWGEDLREHIYLHCIVTGGALVRDEGASAGSRRLRDGCFQWWRCRGSIGIGSVRAWRGCTGRGSCSWWGRAPGWM